MTDFAGTRKPARRVAMAEEADSPAPVSPITRELSEYVAGALARPLPAEVAEKTRHHLLDTLAAMVSGSRLPPGRQAIAYVRAQGGRRQATVVGSRIVTTAINAALANGMSAHADETDDLHIGGRFHPGCAVVPAALAAAELADRDGASLLGAVASATTSAPASSWRSGFLAPTAGRTAPTAWAACSARRPRPARCSASTRAGAVPAVLRRAAGIGPRLLDARPGPHREGVRLRRHAGAQRRRRGDHGGRGLHRGRGPARRSAHLPRGVRRGAAAPGADRGWAAGSRSCRRRSRSGPRARRSRRRSMPSRP